MNGHVAMTIMYNSHVTRDNAVLNIINQSITYWLILVEMVQIFLEDDGILHPSPIEMQYCVLFVHQIRGPWLASCVANSKLGIP